MSNHESNHFDEEFHLFRLRSFVFIFWVLYNNYHLINTTATFEVNFYLDLEILGHGLQYSYGLYKKVA